MLIKRFVTSFPRLLALILLALIGTLILPPAAPLVAQYHWSLQQRIPDYDDEARTPYLVADQNRTVHAFNYQPVGDREMAIFYRQWTVEQRWTTPVDILLPDTNVPDSLQGVFLDRAGTLHLIYFAGYHIGGNQLRGTINYSRARAANAGRASAWSTPRAVGEGAGPQTFAALAGDDRGNLIIVYSGQREGIGLYEVHSADGGDTWSEPVIVSLVYEEERWPMAIQLDMDRQGRLHAVWSLVNANGSGEEIYYAKLEADQVQWSEPILLAARDEGDYDANWASIIVRRDELFVIYHDGFPPTRWMRRSTDGGQTWTAPVRPFPHQGTYVYAVLLTDSNEVLHMILGNRTTDVPAIYGMWHSVWLGEDWSALEAVVSGPNTAHFAPENPQAVISQGNTLLVTWDNDIPRDHLNGAWYSYTILDAPELPVVPLPNPTATPTPPATATPTKLPPTPTPTPRAVLSGQSEDLAATTGMNNPAAPVIVGVAPVALLIAVAIVVQRLYYRAR